MKKIIYILMACLAILLLPWASQDVLAASPSVVDNAHLLTESEQAELTSLISQIEQKHHVRIAIDSELSIEGMSARQYANHILDTRYTDGANGSMILVLDMTQRDWYISTDSKMRAKIPEDISLLSEKFVPSLSDGQYVQGFRQYAEGVDQMLSFYEKEGRAYTQADDYTLAIAGIAAALALLFALFIRRSLRASMSNVNPSVSAIHYMDPGSFQLTDHSDVYLFSEERREHIQSGGNGSGGGSHGGGGGKF
jgi:uncharacterized protein